MTSLKLVARYDDPATFLEAFEKEVAQGGLMIVGAHVEGVAAMAECAVDVTVAGHAGVTVPARIAAVMEGVGVAVILEDKEGALASLAARLRGAKHDDDDDAPHGSVMERMRALTATQKMQLAGTADREERSALLRDTNKVLHMYVPKNPRMGTDEVTWAAKSTNLSADTLKYIAEHPEWSNNPGICSALVRNPHTPTTLAIRLLDKIPHAEVRAIAKTASARQAIVLAARRKINE